MNPLLIALGVGAAAYAVTRSSASAPAPAPSPLVKPARDPITYQIVKAETWVMSGVPKETPADEFVIVGDLSRGSFRVKLKAKPRVDGFYDITEVLYQHLPALDIVPGYDHGWLWVPKLDASGEVEKDASGKEIWVSTV